MQSYLPHICVREKPEEWPAALQRSSMPEMFSLSSQVLLTPGLPAVCDPGAQDETLVHII